MYSEWASLTSEIQNDSGTESILKGFNYNSAKSIVQAVVKDIKAGQVLKTEGHVDWIMQSLCYGLSLPSTDVILMEECVDIYCEWINCLCYEQSATNNQPTNESSLTSHILPSSNHRIVPNPILLEGNKYFQVMLGNLINLFKQHSHRQYDEMYLKLCTRVVKSVHNVIVKSKNVEAETWCGLLKFLLLCTDLVLSSPSSQGDSLDGVMLQVLFKSWLIACSRDSFPSPSLWKSLHEMVLAWRHLPALVLNWHQVNQVLQQQLINILYSHPIKNNKHWEMLEICSGMSKEVLIQCWFRFLHLIGSPVDLSSPHLISNTQRFLHLAITSEEALEPLQLSCLKQLPTIFFTVMKSLSYLTDAFLRGMSNSELLDIEKIRKEEEEEEEVSPPPLRKPRVSLFTPLIKHQEETTPPLNTSRPRVNSLLHLLGAWLFDASLVSVTMPLSNPLHSEKDNTRFEAGRAEACGNLCSIFTSLQTNEKVLPVYVSRFYTILYHGLNTESTMVMRKIIFKSSHLFTLNLPAVHLLVPYFLHALHTLFNPIKHKIYKENKQLRKASVLLILSLIPLPFHLTNVPIIPLMDEEDSEVGGKKVDDVQKEEGGKLCVEEKEGVDGDGGVVVKGIRDLINERRVSDGGEKVGGSEGGLRGSEKSQIDKGKNVRINLMTEVKIEEKDIKLKDGKNMKDIKLKDVKKDGGIKDGGLMDGGIKEGGKKGVTFGSLQGDFSSLLLHMMHNEEDPLIFHMILGGLTLMITEMCTQTPTPHDTGVVELYRRTVELICDRLKSTSELTSALSCIESLGVLTSLAPLTRSSFQKGKDDEMFELKNGVLESCAKKVVFVLCDFVLLLCNKPAPAHSKDMHSCIVSAFHCIKVWLVQHHYLTRHHDILHTLMQVVELGVSGSKSQSSYTDLPVHKELKDLKPVSTRVKEAAEALMNAIIDHVGVFPSAIGPSSLCPLIDERFFIQQQQQHTNKNMKTDNKTTEFQYFAIDSSIILALLEPSFEDGVLVAVVRSAFGRRVWLIELKQLQHQALDEAQKTFEPAHLEYPKTNNQPSFKQPLFPECKADWETSMSQHKQQLTRLKQLCQQQTILEKECYERYAKEFKPPPSYTLPKVETISNAVRLFLLHFGFLSPHQLKNNLDEGLQGLEKRTELKKGLSDLDSMPLRTADSVLVCYVCVNQSSIHHILNNTAKGRKLNGTFEDFVKCLGWCVKVGDDTHPSFHFDPSLISPPPHEDTHTNIYDGTSNVLYWSDISTEVVFLLPSPSSVDGQELSSIEAGKISPKNVVSSTSNKTIGTPTNTPISSFPTSSISSQTTSTTTSITSTNTTTITPPITSYSSTPPITINTTNNTSPPITTTTERREDKKSSDQTDAQVVVVWLECFEDHTNFPIKDLLKVTKKPGQESSIIFIHPLNNNLFRIHLTTTQTRHGGVGPLKDGMVVSRRSMPHMLRHTVINMSARNTLHNDQQQPPHVRRRLKIKEIVQECRIHTSQAELLISLFH